MARDLKTPSPFAAEILVARPYAYLDDAPSQRSGGTQAVTRQHFAIRRTSPSSGPSTPGPSTGSAPTPGPLIRGTADELLHDALMLLGFLTAGEGRAGGHEGRFAELVAEGRATVLEGPVPWWVAEAPRRGPGGAAPGGRLASPRPAPGPPQRRRRPGRGGGRAPPGAPRVPGAGSRTGAGPVLGAPGRRRGRGPGDARGRGLRAPPGPVHPGGGRDRGWCERRLLAQIHQETLGRLRRRDRPGDHRHLPALPLRLAARYAGVAPRGPRGPRRRPGPARGDAGPRPPAWEGSSPSGAASPTTTPPGSTGSVCQGRAGS